MDHEDKMLKEILDSAVPWIGVDLDGTLAEYNGWVSQGHIGKPIWRMVNIVKRILERNIRVKIFTARAGFPKMEKPIQTWLEKAGLPSDLEVTNVKDHACIMIIDDRAVQVIRNKGFPILYEDTFGIFAPEDVSAIYE